MDAEGAGYHFTSAPIEQHLKIIFAKYFSLIINSHNIVVVINKLQLQTPNSKHCRGYPMIKSEDCDPINQFNPVISLCLSQARIWISNITCDGLFMFNELR